VTTETVLPIIGLVLYILGWLVIVRSLLSWFPNARGNALVDIVFQVTDPILLPLQRIVPRIGIIDISPMIAVILLFVLASLLGAPGA
jgi:YggT family protein